MRGGTLRIINDLSLISAPSAQAGTALRSKIHGVLNPLPTFLPLFRGKDVRWPGFE